MGGKWSKYLLVMGMILLLGNPVTASAADYHVRYECYAYAEGGGDPLGADEILDGETSASGDYYHEGDPAAGNSGHGKFWVDLTRGLIRSYGQSVGDVTDYWPFGFVGTGRVQYNGFKEKLSFEVPAGYYPDGVHVSLRGWVRGTIASTLNASCQMNAIVGFGDGWYLGNISIGNDESNTVVVDEEFEATWEVVSPGQNLSTDTVYHYFMTANLGSLRTSSILEGGSPDYLTGTATVDFYDGGGMQFTEVVTPEFVTWWSGSGVFMSQTSTVDSGAVPARVALEQNHPNPFNPTTTIRFSLPEPAAVDLRVFDVSGRLVRILRREEALEAGRHETVWRGRDDSGRELPAGVYVYRLDAGEFTSTKRMTLLK